MTQTITERLHIVEGSDWKDAVIALLEPDSPYQPWRYAFGEAHVGDPVAVILDTDPVSLLTVVGRIGGDGNPARAIIELPYRYVSVIDLATFVMAVGLEYDNDPRNVWRLDGDAAVRMELALQECRYRISQGDRSGHTSVAAARVLLHSGGRCGGCDMGIDLTEENARDQVHIHTVAPARRPSSIPPIKTRIRRGDYDEVEPSINPRPLLTDWPAVLCDHCHDRMRDGGYHSVVDYRFAQHPTCPSCGGRRTQSIFYGMPATFDFPPWKNAGGCSRKESRWNCELCWRTW